MFSPDGFVHYSALKWIGKSPLHYAYHAAKTDFDTKAMRIGRAVHALTLQDIEPVVFPGDRRGSKWKEFVEEQRLAEVALHDEDHYRRDNIADVLTATEWDDVRRMRDAVVSDKHAAEYLSACQEREVPIEWARMGYPCRGKIDLRSTDRRILGDLKTCADSSPWKFLRDAERMYYHAQLPFYDEGQGTVYNGPDTNWSEQFIIAVESKVPFPVMVYKLVPLRIDQGYEETVRWMMEFDACMKAGAWSRSYEQGVHEWDAEIRVSSGDDSEDED